jgi:hypothetical protein
MVMVMVMMVMVMVMVKVMMILKASVAVYVIQKREERAGPPSIPQVCVSRKTTRPRPLPPHRWKGKKKAMPEVYRKSGY